MMRVPAAGSMRTVCGIIAVVVLASTLWASADETADVARGRAIATGGAKAGTSACASCHGAKGEGQDAAGFPRLAGLEAAYIARQIEMFRTPQRANPVMSPIAETLDAAAVRDVAAYYASLPAPDAPRAGPSTPQITAGSALARNGDWSKQAPPCASCHGATGLGVGAAFPPLAGQPAAYIAGQLKAWQAGTRGGDSRGLMKTAVARLTKDEIAAVAAYYASLSAAKGASPLSEAAGPARAADDDGLAAMVREGEAIFRHTRAKAGPYVANSLSCENCHLDAGRLANSAPMGAAYLLYPAYRKKNGHVNTFAERLQGCFRYSMNGKAPPLGDNVLVALESYAFSLAKGSPVGFVLPGRGYPRLVKPTMAPDFARGATVFAGKCAICHGSDGLGQKADGATIFPALWGPDSFNWGAGMESLANASGFIKANMPLGQGGSLTDQEAWDVALFMDSQERPQDPRFTGDVATTRAKFHDTPMSMYGRTVGGVLLGQPPSETAGKPTR